MHKAVIQMLQKYPLSRLEDYNKALREIIQEIALLGLWRGKFFEKAAFYGGTALRILYGLDRFSEDLDFTLLQPMGDFDLGSFGSSLEKELLGFGFEMHLEQKNRAVQSPVQSAFLKANTFSQMLVIEIGEEILRQVPKGQMIKIKLEVDTNPPPDFSTEMKYLLAPIPFPVRVLTLPDLFAGKMHAVLYRRWKTRVKGRDWYDLVWYVSHHPELHLGHLEQRMRQTGDWNSTEELTVETFFEALHAAIDSLDIDKAREEVSPFIKDPEVLSIWSREFFHDIVSRINLV
ncbi:MAG TPA: nucleotidyl transferase AbiEii/AbiGii toxin family protein [Desulfomonilia bacterium]|nr:nucleotidyl transferase AbiEii/AbiGii toxin family protein [Desulfomonilia bacterium]HRV36852.1 nucleotidyl transferase AbiEii/AbiGii toxin family protein [Desulfomonilia bacterium]